AACPSLSVTFWKRVQRNGLPNRRHRQKLQKDDLSVASVRTESKPQDSKAKPTCAASRTLGAIKARIIARGALPPSFARTSHHIRGRSYRWRLPFAMRCAGIASALLAHLLLRPRGR